MSEQKKEKRVKRPKSKARKIVEWILTGIFLALFAFVMAGQIDGMVHKKDHYNQQIRFGYGTFMVKTDSMKPVYGIDTALITYNEDPEKILQRFEKVKPWISPSSMSQSRAMIILNQRIIQSSLFALTRVVIRQWMAFL